MEKENSFKRVSRRTELEKEENNMVKEQLLGMGRTDIEGSIRGPCGPKKLNIDTCESCFGDII